MDLISFSLLMLAQLRQMHWLTTNYVVHQTLGTLYSKVDPLVDTLVESYLGSGGSREVSRYTPPSQYNSEEAVLKSFKTQLKKFRKNLDSALQNVIDEITGAIDQSLYLMNMA